MTGAERGRPRVVIRDDAVAGVARVLADGLAERLGERPELVVEHGDAPEPRSVVAELGAGRGVGSVLGEEGWPAFRGAVLEWARSVRPHDGVRTLGYKPFQLRASWAATSRCELRIWGIHEPEFGEGEIGEERIRAQLEPYRSIVGEALAWFETSDDPPAEMTVEGSVGESHPSIGCELRFSENRDEEPMRFSVRSDRSVSWYRTPDRPVPPVIAPAPGRPPDDETLGWINPVRPDRDPPRLYFERYRFRIWLWFQSDPTDVGVTTAQGEFKAAAMAASKVLRDNPDRGLEAVELLWRVKLRGAGERDPEELLDYNEVR